MEANRKLIKSFDWLLLLLVMALVTVGILMIANATGNPTASRDEGWRAVVASMEKGRVIRTILWVVVGLVASVVVMFVDYHTYGAAWRLFYWGSNIVLLLALVVGEVVNGSRGWLLNGSIQPSEIAKISLIITLAHHLSQKPNGIQTLKELMHVLVLVGIPLAIILAQNDTGTGFVYIFILLILLFISGTNWKLLAGLGAVGLASLYPLWQLLGDYQKTRFMVFLDPSLDPTGAGLNVLHSKIAIGSGQATGRGFFALGSFCQLDYIPEKETDFIFSIAGETWGFVGAGFIIALYALLLLRLLILSRRSFDKLGSYLIVGVMAMLAFHIFENIGMTLGVMPVTGIPLPFLSYGGSNMVTNMMAIGLVQNVCMRRRYSIFKEGELTA